MLHRHRGAMTSLTPSLSPGRFESLQGRPVRVGIWIKEYADTRCVRYRFRQDFDKAGSLIAFAGHVIVTLHLKPNAGQTVPAGVPHWGRDRKSTRLNSS